MKCNYPIIKVLVEYIGELVYAGLLQNALFKDFKLPCRCKFSSIFSEFYLEL